MSFDPECFAFAEQRFQLVLDDMFSARLIKKEDLRELEQELTELLLKGGNPLAVLAAMADHASPFEQPSDDHKIELDILAKTAGEISVDDVQRWFNWHDFGGIGAGRASRIISQMRDNNLTLYQFLLLDPSKWLSIDTFGPEIVNRMTELVKEVFPEEVQVFDRSISPSDFPEGSIVARMFADENEAKVVLVEAFVSPSTTSRIARVLVDEGINIIEILNRVASQKKVAGVGGQVIEECRRLLGRITGAGEVRVEDVTIRQLDVSDLLNVDVKDLLINLGFTQQFADHVWFSIPIIKSPLNRALENKITMTPRNFLQKILDDDFYPWRKKGKISKEHREQLVRVIELQVGK